MNESELILDFVSRTNKSIFLTGKAGTGKTTLLQQITSRVSKKMAVVAPTAVAAINAGGVTIHSFFQIPFGPLIPTTDLADRVTNLSKAKKDLFRAMETLIIDEISMVRVDMFDYIDALLKHVRYSSSPFGGVQVVMIGDLFQLPPVASKDWNILSQFYAGQFFFNSHVYRAWPIIVFELTKVFRQNDIHFLEILNRVRSGNPSEQDLKHLNECYLTDTGNDFNDYITLTTHIKKVNKINGENLENLTAPLHVFKAVIQGEFSPDAYPTEEKLELKEGARIVFIKNDTSGRNLYYNGLTGQVTKITDTSIVVRCDNGAISELVQETWYNSRYNYSSEDKSITQSSVGSFTQYPIKLAWAITIHKSQGLTFDKAVIDLDGAFSPGHAYVALSRCRTLNGIVLSSPLRIDNILTDSRVVDFMESVQVVVPDKKLLDQAIIDFEFEVLSGIFDLTVEILHFKKMVLLAEDGSYSETQVVKNIKDLSVYLEDKIGKVAQLFINREIDTLDTSISPFCTEDFRKRLKKARDYFLPLLSEFIQKLISILNEIKGEQQGFFYANANIIMLLLTAKIASLERSIQANNAQEIVQATKDAAASYNELKPEPALISAYDDSKLKNVELYRLLKLWRSELATTMNVADYTLVSEKMLKAIAAKAPLTKQLLLKIKGMDTDKMQIYIEQILGIVVTFVKGSNKDLFS